MRGILFGVFLVHCTLFGMDNELPDDAMPALEEPAPEANPTLMRAIKESNHPAVLSALRHNQDQNYLWKASDGEQYKEYLDKTGAIYALKILSRSNRWEFASNLVTALTWDLGNAAMRYAMNSYAAQYPMLQYVDPIRQSHTASLLFESHGQERSMVNMYRPAYRIARDILIKENTDLTIERVAQWNGHPVTVETYLNNMLLHLNPLDRKDAQNLSSELGQVLRERQGISEGDEGFTRREQEITLMGFGANNGRQQGRRGILVLNEGYPLGH